MNPEQYPRVSLVTLNYNGLRFLKDLFDSLRRCSYPNLEVIMVDNCSQDESVAFVQENYPEVRILQNPDNYMYARGNNEGLRIATGEYICLLNNDVDVDPGFIEPIVAAFESDITLGAAQPKILGMQQRDHLEYAGACGGFIDWLGYPFLRGRVFFTIEADEGQYDEPLDIFWASGACFFVRREVLDQVGTIDEDFMLHQEEIDLCWRMRLAGWKVRCVPQARVWHHVGGTLDKDSPRKTYWNFRNNIFLLCKNLSAVSLALRLPLRLPLDVLAFAMELVKGHVKNAAAIVRAYGWLLSHVPLILRKRRLAQSRRRVGDSAVLERMYRGSIVFEYFILGRKRFSELGNHRKLLNPQPRLHGELQKR